MNVEDQLIAAFNDAVEHAAYLLELGDVPDDADEDFRFMVYEERHHCGTCMVNVVLETVWPSLDAYIDYLRCPRLH